MHWVCPLASGLPAMLLMDLLGAFEQAWAIFVRASSFLHNLRWAWLHQRVPISCEGEWSWIRVDG